MSTNFKPGCARSQPQFDQMLADLALDLPGLVDDFVEN